MCEHVSDVILEVLLRLASNTGKGGCFVGGEEEADCFFHCYIKHGWQMIPHVNIGCNVLSS